VPVPDDTHPAVARLQLEGWRVMTPAQKLRRVADLNDGIRQLAAAGLRGERPDLTGEEVRLELACRWLPPELREIARQHAARARRG
jgi:hypothetical protein